MNIEENKHLSETKAHICIIGLGYVGLPLAIEFANEYDVIGFDINSSRIDELNDFIDNSGEVSEDALINAKRLTLSRNLLASFKPPLIKKVIIPP